MGNNLLKFDTYNSPLANHNLQLTAHQSDEYQLHCT